MSGSECPICWIDPPVNAIKLTCGHIFCFLCIKSSTIANNSCPYCRADIRLDLDFGYINVIGGMVIPEAHQDGCYWMYEGKKGWWFYDAETNSLLEQSYIEGIDSMERLIAGRVYVISLTNMNQFLKQEPSRSRQIRRAIPNDSMQGVAGIRDRELLEAIKRAAPVWNRLTLNDESVEDVRF